MYYEQQGGIWRPEGFSDDTWKNLKDFDQTTLWWMTEKMDKYKDLNIGIFHDDIRWNYFTQYAYEGLTSIELPQSNTQAAVQTPPLPLQPAATQVASATTAPINPATGLTTVETALLSPSEQAIRLKQRV